MERKRTGGQVRLSHLSGTLNLVCERQDLLPPLHEATEKSKEIKISKRQSMLEKRREIYTIYIIP